MNVTWHLEVAIGHELYTARTACGADFRGGNWRGNGLTREVAMLTCETCKERAIKQ